MLLQIFLKNLIVQKVVSHKNKSEGWTFRVMLWEMRKRHLQHFKSAMNSVPFKGKCMCVHVCVCYLLSRVWLCNPTDYNLSGFSVHGILQARILEWIAIPFSRGTSQPRGRTLVSCIAGRFFTVWATGKSFMFIVCSIFKRCCSNNILHPTCSSRIGLDKLQIIKQISLDLYCLVHFLLPSS